MALSPKSNSAYLAINASDVSVKVNGKEVAQHDGGYSTWRVNITDHITDTTEIADEISAVQAIFEEYKSLIMTGTGGQESIDAMMAAMREAGFDTILNEVNAQFAAWKAN